MSDDAEEPKGKYVTEEGIPYDPSADAFREAILAGKSKEEAEYIAKLVGEAKADTVDGFVRHRLKMAWAKVAAWASGLIAAAVIAITAYGTEKVNAFLESLLR